MQEQQVVFSATGFAFAHKLLLASQYTVGNNAQRLAKYVVSKPASVIFEKYGFSLAH